MTDLVGTNPDLTGGNPVFRLAFNGCSATGVPLPDGRFLLHAGAVGRAVEPEYHPWAPLRAGKIIMVQSHQATLVEEGTMRLEGERVVLAEATIFPMHEGDSWPAVEWATWILGTAARTADEGGGYHISDVHTWWKTDRGQTLQAWYRAQDGPVRKTSDDPERERTKEKRMTPTKPINQTDKWHGATGALTGEAADRLAEAMAEYRRTGDIQVLIDRGVYKLAEDD